MSHVSILLDESGTAATREGDKCLFVTGGIACIGDLEQLSTAWSTFSSQNQINPSKGRKATLDHMMATAQFLNESGAAFPIAYSCWLDPEQLDQLASKIARFLEIRKAGGIVRITVPHHAWIHQMVDTVQQTMVSLAKHGHAIHSALIAIDEYNMPDDEKALLRRQLIESIVGMGTRLESLAARRQNVPGYSEFVDRIVPAFNAQRDAVKVELDIRGDIKRLVDIVASSHRRALLGDESARTMWDVLSVGFRSRFDIQFDVTKSLGNAILADWPLE